ANRAAVQYYGYAKDQLLTMTIKDLNLPPSEPVVQEMLQAKSDRRNHFQFIHRLANGEQRDVEVYSFPVQVDEKVLLFSIIHDVSEKLHKELMLHTLFFNSPYAVVFLNREQKIANVNRNFTRVFQYEPAEAIGKNINQLLSSSENKTEIDHNLQLVYQGEIVKQESVRRRKDGKLIHVEILGYPVLDRGKMIGVYVIYQDISDKKAYEEQLLLFRKILENNSEGVVITDMNGYIEWVNNAFEEITGFSFSEIAGKNMNVLKSGIQDRSFYKNMWEQLLHKGRWSGEIWNKTKRGEIYSEWLTINRIRDSANKKTYYVGIFKDISEKKKIDRRISELQQKDILTGLYNRNYFLELVDSYIKSCKKDGEFSIIFIDIEEFKDINNSLGHHIGDKLLVELSKRLRLSINENCVLSRYSGDEFALLCKFSASEKNIKRMAQNLLENIRRPFMIENTILNITVNIGISRFPYDGKDAETLVRHAETAMYKVAKGQLDDRICFYSEEMSKEIEKRFFLINLLMGAIPKKELSICYQPICDIMNPQNIVGVEALLRWNNFILGNVPPDTFIPLAEKTGLIIPIGEWVLEQVCEQIRLWEEKGFRVVPVAVNISAKQLEQSDFSKKVIGILEKNHVHANCIELEITENICLGDFAMIVKNLKELKQHEIQISMDDFGTGFSSIGQLEIFELDKLKIDKIFIDNLLHASKKQNLVDLIIGMAKSLNLTVVAEGIETKEQLAYLKKLGCHLGQGYLFSKPLPSKEIEALLSLKNHKNLKKRGRL
ncbi:MAG TPA: EAL domain-containing protein, partial [Clostridiales bacterium]|nr:EAL domain-containing protein [Clostridiales bacterium]